jgi:hypothetical protein
MDESDRALLEQTVRDAFAGADTDAPLDTTLTDLGWQEMLDAEPRDAIAIVFTALGSTNGLASVLDDVVAFGLGAKPSTDVAIVLPQFGAWTPPGKIDGEHLSAGGLATWRVTTATEILVVCHAATDLVTVTVPVAAAEISTVHGIDPDAGFHRVRVQHDAAELTPLDPEAWDGAIALGRRAVGHQIAGAGRAMLDLARTHALERVQFDRPIARFQAVRHRLAEALVAIEALDAALAAAADEPDPLTAALAKAAAGRAARAVAGHCQQVLAGIGFTTEHPFHQFLKRTMLLDGILGSADAIVVDVGHRLLATRTVPTLIEL